MVDRLVKILKNEVPGGKWLINYEQVNSKELFFIKDKLDMNRAKSVAHCRVTLYNEIKEGENEYLGSAGFKAAASMSDEEIVKCIKDGLYSASLVKNPKYDLVKSQGDTLPSVQSNISFKNAETTLKKVIDLVYDLDKKNASSVNSMEIFLEDINTRVANSEGVDYSYSIPKLMIELVVDIAGEKEEVELYDMIEVSSFDEALLREKINADFVNVERRANAQKLSLEKEVPVVLTGEAVCEMFSYYTYKANAAVVYKKYSQLKIGDFPQGEDAKGDLINITMMPEIPNSAESKYVDGDGVVLKEMPLFKDGKLLKYNASNRFGQYCDVEITGTIPNISVHPGSTAYESMLKGDCLEVISFSDFQTNGVTGDFGGEIRLAILHMDGEATPVTGGSITGNINEVHGNMLLSKEIDITRNYQHPKAIKIEGTKISC